MRIRYGLLALLLGLSIQATGKTTEDCKVVGISDGDTITVRCGDAAQQKVRLAEIDTPERGQPFGRKAKERLSDLIYLQAVELKIVDRDRYGRIVATVVQDGENINFQLVREGLAWCYDRYVRDRQCYRYQSLASEAGIGLWSEANPIQPWQWRRGIR